MPTPSTVGTLVRRVSREGRTGGAGVATLDGAGDLSALPFSCMPDNGSTVTSDSPLFVCSLSC